MFFEILNIIFYNLNNPSNLEPRLRSIKIVVIMRLVVTSNVSIKRIDCNN